MSEFPRYLHMVHDLVGNVMPLGAGSTPDEALGPLRHRLENQVPGPMDLSSGVTGIVLPPHALYLNTSGTLPETPQELNQLIMSDPFLHAVFKLGMQHALTKASP